MTFSSIGKGQAGPSVWLCCVWCIACDSPQSHTYIQRFSANELTTFGVLSAATVSNGGSKLPRPPGGPLRDGEEKPMLAGPAAQRGTQEPGRRALGFRPDRVTQLEGTLGYFEVFTPAITPFKRVSALDAVTLDGITPVLTVGDPRRSPIKLEGLEAAPPDARARDRFWASVVLDFSEGNVVPLPTVSPESRILHMEIEPNTGLTLERDGADNLYAVADRVGPQQVRVTYVLDAPRNYFGATLPARTAAPGGEPSPLPEKVQRDALIFARELGLSGGTDSATALRKLVEHFRSFEESRISPEDTGNILLDLARGKRGVCRHRAYAFVIVAQALGIPARFVQNEAHAWVEVRLPELGWLRIDLGGAAEGLSAHATENKPFYRPETEDPWPRPRAYEDSYARAQRAAEDKAKSGGLGPARGNAGDRGRNEQTLRPTLSSAQSRARVAESPDGRIPVLLNVSRYFPEVLRGSSFEVEGTARQRSGAPVPGLRIEVSLAATDAERAVLLGVSVTDDQGLFHGVFTVPPGIEPSDYALVVVTPGDARHAAARAD